MPKQDAGIVDGFDNILDRFLTKHTVVEKDERENPHGWVDILTFAESDYYLRLHLHPWQRLILKVMYMGTPGNHHLGLMDAEEPCCANCVWQNNSLAELSPCFRCRHFDPEERERLLDELQYEFYLQVDELRDADLSERFLNEVMMIEQDLDDTSDATFGGSVRQQFKSKIGKAFTELVLVLGRRAGKSMIVSIVALYEAYKLIQMGHPQKFFRNLRDGDTITILNVAPSESSAKEAVFDKIKDMVVESPYFKSKISPGSLLQREVRFLTPRDQKLNEDLANDGLSPIEGTIYLLSGHSNSDSLVGKTALVVILDEMASLNNREGSKMSDQELYIRLKNCTLTFRDQAKIMCISSPMTKDGQFFNLYESSFKNDRVLMVQLPSWKVNPSVTEDWLKEQQKIYVEQGVPHMYTMEIEARFLGGASSPLLPAEKVDDAMKRGVSLQRIDSGDPRKQYFAHADAATNSDNYAFAILHAEDHPYVRDEVGRPLPILYVDHVQMWSPTRNTDGSIEPVNIAECDEYIIKMYQRFRFLNLSYDQWGCLHPDSLLLGAKGLTRAGAVLRGDVLYGKDGSLNTVTWSQIIPDQPGYRIRTKFGYEIECNEIHPLWTHDGFVEARCLGIGDEVALSEVEYGFGHIDMVDEAVLAGYLVSEGDVGGGRVRFSNNDEDVVSDYLTVFDRLFGFRPRPYEKNRGNDKWGTNFSLYTMKKLVVETVSETWGVAGKSHQKNIPEFVLKGNKRTASAFLSSLYEGDGTVSTNRQCLCVSYDTVSGELAAQIQVLLSAFGIKTSRKCFTRDDQSYQPCHRVTIYGDNILTFAAEIGFRSPAKQSRLDRCVQYQLDIETKKGSKPNRKLRKHPKGRKSRSRRMWDKIVEITPITLDIANIEVDGDHTYVGNGIVCHNSDASIQKMQALGIPAQKTQFTNDYMSVIFGELLSLFLQDRIVLYANGPFAEETSDQLKFLQKRYTAAGHRIEAVKGHHDDIPACIAGAAHCATSGIRSVASLPKIRTKRFAALNGR